MKQCLAQRIYRRDVFLVQVSRAFCLSKKFPVFTVCLIGNTQIRVFSRGHLSLKQEKEKSFCGGRSRETKKVLGREEVWHAWQ